MSPSRRATPGGRIRVALFATHPIQYQVPWYRLLAARPEIELKVFFGMIPDAAQQGVGFGVGFRWDLPMLDGYAYEVLRNVAGRPSVSTFTGCDTPGVARAISAWQPDLAILTGWHAKMLVQARWACARQGVRCVVRGESSALARRPRWKRIVHRVWLSGFDRFLAIGEANRDFYRQAGIPEARIHGCPYIVDNQRFAAAADEMRSRRAELRRRWSIPPDATCFLFCGKLIGKKRPLDLLQAMRRATKDRDGLHLLVVGDGELMADARILAERDNLPVTFAGFLNQTEIVGAYVAADCLVLPSDAGETWGLVVNEAMACGLPAIVSDRVGCGPDLVLDGVTGARFPVGDVGALARRLADYARDPSARRAMGAQARERVLSRYTLDRAVEGTLAAITAAVAQG